jgi:predicted RNA binding protein YcfA (HicA-like mRNA interferase family)
VILRTCRSGIAGFETVTKSVPFSKLAGVLESIGFTAAPVEGQHHVFVHSKTNATVMLPPVSGGRIGPVHIAAVARLVDEKGILERSEFERRLFSAAPAGGNGNLARKPQTASGAR